MKWLCCYSDTHGFHEKSFWLKGVVFKLCHDKLILEWKILPRRSKGGITQERWRKRYQIDGEVLAPRSERKEVFVFPYKTSTLTNGAPQSDKELMEPLMSSLSFELESKSVRESNTAAPWNAVHDQAHAPSSQCLSLFFPTHPTRGLRYAAYFFSSRSIDP
jgi:hypothetical protein